MTPTLAIDNPQRLARLAGVFYLVIIVAGIWSEAVVRAGIIVHGDAAATAANIIENAGLFRLSTLADTVLAVSDAALAVLLFVLLRPAGILLALAAMVFRLLQAAVIGANLINQHAALMVLDGTVAGMTPETAQGLAMLSVTMHGYGYDLGLVFFGINSLLTGALLVRSGYFPRVLGIAIVITGLVYLVGSTLRILDPALYDAFLPAYGIAVLAETAFALWLLIRGVNPDAFARRSGG